jgi:peptidoglycan/xylan/chitin deacetylase (PgdA/CDA1 family)
LWAECLARSGALWWARRKLEQQGAIVVMAFHRVLDDRTSRLTASLPGMIVCEGTFEAVAAYVARRYAAVDPALVRPGEYASRLRFVFTFDDGWRDNATTMLPIAAKHGIPTTVFLCTGLQDEYAPFWPERVAGRMMASASGTTMADIEAEVELLKRQPRTKREDAARITSESGWSDTFKHDRTLSAEQVAGMHAAGVRIGAHTRSHVILTEATEPETWDEIAGSKRDIEQALGTECNLFAYPNGNTGPAVRACVQAAAFHIAFTTEQGAWNTSSDLLAVPRMCAWEGSFTGLIGRFSPVMFDYTMIWRTWRAEARRMRGNTLVCERPTAGAHA